MRAKLIWGDICRNKLLSAATIFFMAVSAMLLALSALLFAELLGSVDALMDAAVVPDFLQMHAGDLDVVQIEQFAAGRGDVQDWQVSRFLNLTNGELTLGDENLASSTQDNGLSVQNERFDFLLAMDYTQPAVAPGEVYVPVCYRDLYDLSIGDPMRIGNETLRIAGFVRDAQMNSMMSSSKRFLVCAADYEELKGLGSEEYIIEFLLSDGAGDFAAAYASAGLPANGPAITRSLIRMINALADGTFIFVLFLVGIVVLLVCMLCIHYILQLQLERDRRQIGTLKAIGIGKREMRRIYFGKYLLFSAIGISTGLVGAAFLKAPLTTQMQELYGTAGEGSSPALASVLAAAAVEALILLSVWHTLRKMDAMSAVDALFREPTKGKAWKQYALIATVVAACTFLLLVPLNLYTTLVSPGFVTWMGIGDATIRMDIRAGEDTDAKTQLIEQALAQDPQVQTYAVLQTRSIPAVLSNDETVNLTVESGDHLAFPVRYLQGSAPVGPSEIALSYLNAQELGLRIGDTLALMHDGVEMDYVVSGIYADITNGGKTAKTAQIATGAPVIWTVAYVSPKGSGNEEEWAAAYEQLGADITDIEQYVRDTYAQTLSQLRLACMVAAVIAGGTALLVVGLFVRLLVEKDRYEISLRKTIGFRSASIRRAYVLRALSCIMAGALAGTVLAQVCGEALCGAVLYSLGAPGFHFLTDWVQALAASVGAVAVAAAAVFLGTRAIAGVVAHECCDRKE